MKRSFTVKKKYFVLPLIFLSFCLLAFMFAEYSIESILQKLQMTDEDAKEYVWSDCSGCYFGHPMPGVLKDSPLSERPAIVKAVGEFAKLYTRSDDFKRRYLEYREGSKPQPPQPPESMDETRKKQKEQMQKSIQEMEKNRDKMPAGQRPEFDKIIKAMKEQMAEIEKEGSVLYSAENEQYMKQGYEAEMQEYKEKLAQWEKEYPKEPDEMIKRWLGEFLKASADVNFNAELSTDESGRKRFVNPEYEGKSHLWKLCFRSGRETTEAGRKFASAWLKELK